jgi:ketosteroid isomerase-like protein
MRTVLLFSLITSAILTTSCGPSAPVDSSAADAAAIQALDEQWSATAARNDLAGTVAFYVRRRRAGSSQRADRQGSEVDPRILGGPVRSVSWKVSKAEVGKSGELGYLYGTYELSTKDAKGGQPVRDIGKLVEIWKKQPDGKWRCIVDTYNSDLPVPAAPEAKK